MMVVSILGSFKPFLWVVLVLSVLFYIFGITFTHGTMVFLETTEMRLSPEYQNLQDYFGTLTRSVLHLYMAISNGADWSLHYQALSLLSAHYGILFLIFITFSIACVMNIVAGVFVENAILSSHQDKQAIVNEELHQ